MKFLSRKVGLLMLMLAIDWISTPTVFSDDCCFVSAVYRKASAASGRQGASLDAVVMEPSFGRGIAFTWLCFEMGCGWKLALSNESVSGDA